VAGGLCHVALPAVADPGRRAPAALSSAIKLSLVLVAAWSAYVDLHFFREVLPRPGGSAWDLFLQRAVGWSCSGAYFLGIAIWPEIAGRIV
jgi:hypothetical protein